MEHMSNIFSTSFGINFAKNLVWLALISLTAQINSLLFLSHPVYFCYSVINISRINSNRINSLQTYIHTCSTFVVGLYAYRYY